MKKKNIILGITGSIAASKSPQIIKELLSLGHKVKCILTRNAEQFIDFEKFPIPQQDLILEQNNRPLTKLAAGKKALGAYGAEDRSVFNIHEDLSTGATPQFPSAVEFDRKFLDTKNVSIDHINLARWADIILIAPASANTIAKLACGIADDNLSSTCLATEAKILIAPAMNKVMWEKKTNKQNIEKIQSLGIKILGPCYGEQACGDIGYGRMLEPDEIVKELEDYIKRENLMKGTKVLITAGPTQEPMDPVRYISNRSSGKMGFAIATAFIESGAEVTIISGPVNLSAPGKCKIVKVKTANEMLKGVMAHIKTADLFIGCAAVSDYRVKDISNTKIKKSSEELTLSLVRNPDILKEVARLYPEKFIVGFAAETNDLEFHAERKLKDKKLDLIVANEVGINKGFDQDHNEICIIDKSGNKTRYNGHKDMLAEKILDHVLQNFRS